MKSLHQLAADVTRENLKKTLAELGGQKQRKALHVRLVDLPNESLGIQAEVASACSQEILAETTQEVLHAARNDLTNQGFALAYDEAAYHDFGSLDVDAENSLPNMIRKAIDQLDAEEATVFVSPMVLTYLQISGDVFTRESSENLFGTHPTKAGLFDGKHVVRCDQYADKNTPILVTKDGWFSYVGEKYVDAYEVKEQTFVVDGVSETVPVPAGERLFAYETDVKFTVHPDNFRLIIGR